jgi:hypothetical protein
MRMRGRKGVVVLINIYRHLHIHGIGEEEFMADAAAGAASISSNERGRRTRASERRLIKSLSLSE